jgi:beta-lactam-binding protein with PASTA domain
MNGAMAMMAHRKSTQRGISFIGLVVVASLLAMAGVVAAQVFPTVVEYLAIQKAAQKAAIEGQTPDEIRTIFSRAADIDDIKSISPKELEISKQGDKVVVGYAYEREIHLVGPAFLTLKYKGQSK